MGSCLQTQGHRDPLMARPKSPNPRDRRVIVLVTEAEGGVWDEMAARERMTLSEFVRAAVNRYTSLVAPKRILRKVVDG